MASWSVFKKNPPQRSEAATNLMDNTALGSSTKSYTSGQKLVGGNQRREKTKPRTTIHSSDEEEDVGSDVDEEELLKNATPYDEDEDQSSIGSREALYEVEALSKFDGQEEGDLSFKQREVLTVLESSRDDGWLMAENAIGERGLIPSNFVKKLSTPGQAVMPDPAVMSATPRRGRDLWTKLRKTVNETSVGDVLCALGAIPSGFRDSTMARLLKESKYLASTWIKPRPSKTGMGFLDLKWNHCGDYLQPCPAKVSCEVIIYMARNIPLPRKGIAVLSRHVRVAVFNKDDILSNIHSVKAAWSGQDEKTWKFLPKSQTAACSQYHRTLTVRLDSSDLDLELLFEFAISFVQETSGERGELSCGWCSLPLFSSTGNPIANKTYQLKLHGGTPFESGIEIDASNIKVSGGKFPSILRTNRMPVMYVRIASLSKAKMAVHSLLPPTLIVPSTYNQTISCFRHLVGVACLRGRLGLNLPCFVVRPALNIFLDAINQSDVMDKIMKLVQDHLKTAKRVNKRNFTYVTELLEDILLRHIYQILTSSGFPSQDWDDESVEKLRAEFMENMNKINDHSAILPSEAKQKSFRTLEQFYRIY